MRKKIILLFILMLSIIVIWNFRNRDNLKLGKYETQGGQSFIVLEKGNKFAFNILKAISYKSQGTYRIKDNELTLFCEDGVKYVFIVKNNCLIYQGVRNSEGAVTSVSLGDMGPGIIYVLNTKEADIKFTKMDLDAVKKLSKKGDKLVWGDFKTFEGRDVGSGLYIMEYWIDTKYRLLVGGSGDSRVLNEKPMYVYLEKKDSKGNPIRIDIRYEDVEKFINSET